MTGITSQGDEEHLSWEIWMVARAVATDFTWLERNGLTKGVGVRPKQPVLHLAVRSGCKEMIEPAVLPFLWVRS